MILLSDDAADEVLAKTEDLVFIHFLTSQSNMSCNKGISGEQLQHDWLFTFNNNQKKLKTVNIPSLHIL